MIFTKEMKTFGFFFLNHTAHIYHAASVAFELSAIEGNRVKIFTSTQRNLDLILVLTKSFPNHRCDVVFLEASLFYQISRFFKKRMFPGFKAIFLNNIKKFHECDVFVSPSDDILGLKKNVALQDKKFIHILHGAGDLGYSFDTSLYRFDKVLLAGNKLADLFDTEKKRSKISTKVEREIVGYPKIELCNKYFKSSKDIFSNGKKTVLYTPHFDQKYSSWNKCGKEILAYFISQDKFNLIVSPHILCEQSVKQELSKKKYISPNIFIDTDVASLAKVDMSYLFEADIYLGDKSSQVYEFLIQPRPCIFLNPHHFDWKDSNDANLDAWHLGDVIESVADLDEKLESAEHQLLQFKTKQQLALRERISEFEEGASLRAAKTLAAL